MEMEGGWEPRSPFPRQGRGRVKRMFILKKGTLTRGEGARRKKGGTGVSPIEFTVTRARDKHF